MQHGRWECDMYGDLLPIGSVVLLKGANKRVMIISRIQAMADTKAIYDYASCPYPEGIVDPENIIFFNRDDIERVYFIGFQDPEELRYREQVLAPLGELYVNDEGRIVERPTE